MKVSHYRTTRWPLENRFCFANVHNSLAARKATEETNSDWIQAITKWKAVEELIFLYFFLTVLTILTHNTRLRYIKLWRYNFLCKIWNRLFYNLFMLDFIPQSSQIEQSSQTSVTELKNENIRYQTELSIRNTDLESTRRQLEAALA